MASENGKNGFNWQKISIVLGIVAYIVWISAWGQSMRADIDNIKGDRVLNKDRYASTLEIRNINDKLDLLIKMRDKQYDEMQCRLDRLENKLDKYAEKK